MHLGLIVLMECRYILTYVSGMRPCYSNDRDMIPLTVHDEPWCCAKYVATISEYVDTKKAIAKLLSEDDRQNMEEWWGDGESPLDHNARHSI